MSMQFFPSDRAPLHSPVFTGDPKSTAMFPPGEDDSSVATTAFVRTAVTEGLAGVFPWGWKFTADNRVFRWKDSTGATIMGARYPGTPEMSVEGYEADGYTVRAATTLYSDSISSLDVDRPSDARYFSILGRGNLQVQESTISTSTYRNTRYGVGEVGLFDSDAAGEVTLRWPLISEIEEEGSSPTIATREWVGNNVTPLPNDWNGTESGDLSYFRTAGSFSAEAMAGASGFQARMYTDDSTFSQHTTAGAGGFTSQQLSMSYDDPQYPEEATGQDRLYTELLPWQLHFGQFRHNLSGHATSGASIELSPDGLKVTEVAAEEETSTTLRFYTETGEALSGHIATQEWVHEFAPPGPPGPPGGSDAATAEWVETGPLTKAALSATIEAGVTTPERTQIQHRLAGTTEPGTFIAWTADDGYGSFADYFSLLSSKGIRGTLFLTQNWVGKAGIDPNWNDTYITQAQVQAIADAGHEIGTHAVNHEDMQTYLAEHGAAALDAMATASRDYVETTYGVPCRTGAYPGGSSNGLVREVIGRSHEYFRGTKGMVAHRGQDPFDVLAVDVQPLNEAQIKARVDEAYATGSLCVFLIHGIATADLPAALTKFGNVIDYATGLGIRHGTFYDGMRERTAVRGAAAYSLDTSGHLFARSVRTNRVTINRNDTGGDHAYLDVDETTNRPFFDATGGQPWEFRSPLEVAAGVNGTTLRVGQRVTVADGVTVNGSTTLTSATAGFKGFDVGRTVAGTGIPAGATIVSVQSPTSVTMSATATASVSGIVLTIGRPNELISIEGDTELWRGVKVHHANGVQFRGTNDDTDQGRITTSTWSRSGVGGPMTIDTGSGGSAFTIKAATAGLTDHAGAKKIRLSAAPPPDASITAGEVVLWFDSTNGAAKLQIKGKTADGTVVAGAVPLT